METGLDFAPGAGVSTHSVTNLSNLQTDNMITSDAGCLGDAATCLPAPGILITQSATLDALTLTDALNVNGASTSGGAGFEAGTLAVKAAFTSVEVLAETTSNTGQVTASGPLIATTAQTASVTMAEVAATQAAVALASSGGDAASGAPAAQLSTPQAIIPTLGAEIAQTTRAHLGQDATRLTPAPLTTGQLAAVTAQFGSITTTGGCLGC